MIVHRIGTNVAKESASTNRPRPRSSVHQYDWKLPTSLKQLVPQTTLFAEANGQHASSGLAHSKHFLVYGTNRQSQDSWATAPSVVNKGGGAVVSVGTPTCHSISNSNPVSHHELSSICTIRRYTSQQRCLSLFLVLLSPYT